MRLRLLDSEHAHDEQGELWVRVADHWRRADDPPPAEGPTSIFLVACAAHGWHRVPDGMRAIVMYAPGPGLCYLTLNGSIWPQAWRILFTPPRRSG